MRGYLGTAWRAGLVALVAMWASPAATARHCEGVVLTDLTTARVRSAREQRPIILFFYDQSVFSSEERQALDQVRANQLFCSSFIFVDFDTSSTEAIALSRRLHISIAPAIAVLSSSRDSVHAITRIEGLHSFEELRNIISSDVCDAVRSEEVHIHPRIVAALKCGVRARSPN